MDLQRPRHTPRVRQVDMLGNGGIDGLEKIPRFTEGERIELSPYPCVLRGEREGINQCSKMEPGAPTDNRDLGAHLQIRQNAASLSLKLANRKIDTRFG
jgi:hypothetical protein